MLARNQKFEGAGKEQQERKQRWEEERRKEQQDGHRCLWPAMRNEVPARCEEKADRPSRDNRNDGGQGVIHNRLRFHADLDKAFRLSAGWEIMELGTRGQTVRTILPLKGLAPH